MKSEYLIFLKTKTKTTGPKKLNITPKIKCGTKAVTDNLNKIVRIAAAKIVWHKKTGKVNSLKTVEIFLINKNLSKNLHTKHIETQAHKPNKNARNSKSTENIWINILPITKITPDIELSKTMDSVFLKNGNPNLQKNIPSTNHILLAKIASRMNISVSPKTQ